MKIEDDLKLHSHLIGQLYEQLYEYNKDFREENKLIRMRGHEMKERLLMINHNVNALDKAIVDQLKFQEKIIAKMKSLEEISDSINCTAATRLHTLDFIREVKNDPKTWIFFLCIFLVVDASFAVDFLLKKLWGVG